jgi:hypothetical protein
MYTEFSDEELFFAPNAESHESDLFSKFDEVPPLFLHEQRQGQISDGEDEPGITQGVYD